MFTKLAPFVHSTLLAAGRSINWSITTRCNLQQICLTKHHQYSYRGSSEEWPLLPVSYGVITFTFSATLSGSVKPVCCTFQLVPQKHMSNRSFQLDIAAKSSNKFLLCVTSKYPSQFRNDRENRQISNGAHERVCHNKTAEFPACNSY